MAHKYTSAHPETQPVNAPVTMPHLLEGRGPGFGVSVQRQAAESRLTHEPGWGLQASPFEKQNWWDPPAEPATAEPASIQPVLERQTILQRLCCSSCEQKEEKEDLTKTPSSKRQTHLMRNAEVGAAGGDVSGDVEQRIQRSRGQGQEIAAPMRGKLEQAFGQDFGGVRIHANTEADQLNRALQAKAFTTGNDIYFKQGEYQPESQGGPALLAHELTHVVQQNTAPPSLQRIFGSDPGEEVTVADHSAQLSRGRNYILAINGTRYILIPLEPNGKTLYFFYGFEASTSDQSILESEAPFIEDDVIYAAEQGFTVVYDLEGTVADFAAAIFDPQAYGIYWSGHGNGHGNIVTSDGRGIGPSAVQASIDLGRRVSPNLQYFILAACNTGVTAAQWQSVLPDQCQFEGWVNLTSNVEARDFTSSAPFGDSWVSHGGMHPDRELRDYIDGVPR